MSIAAIRWAWASTTGSPTHKLVLAALADHADAKGHCYPRVRSLCDKTELSDKAVRQALIRLEEIGALTRSMRKGARGDYVLKLDWKAPDPGTSYRASVDAPRYDVPDHPGTSDRPPRHDVPDTPVPATAPLLITNESTNETPIKPSVRRRSRARGASRIAADWQPGPAERQYALDRGLDPDRVAEEFVNFWIATDGPKARKRSWPATFRNRCLAIVERRDAQSSTSSRGRAGHSVIDAARRLARDIDQGD